MSTDIEKKNQATAISTQSPQPRRGFEEPIERKDLIIPRAKLLQALSPEVVESPRSYFPGEIINSLTKEKLTKTDDIGSIFPVEFVPVFKFTNWIRFNPRDDSKPGFNPDFTPGGLIWSSNDPYDSRVQTEGEFGPNGELPLATKFINFFSLFPQYPGMPIIVSFSKTSYKTGRQLLSLCQFGPPDMYGAIYRLGVRQEKNEMGSYFVLTVAKVQATEGKILNLAAAYWEEFHDRGKEIKVHDQESVGAPSDEDVI